MEGAMNAQASCSEAHFVIMLPHCFMGLWSFFRKNLLRGVTMSRTFWASVFIIFSTVLADAQPSFRCVGDLNRTERAICRDVKLSKLDVQMAANYRNAFAERDERAQRRLRSEQLAWQVWRNSCGGDHVCLTQRYNRRTSDLGPQLFGVGQLYISSLPSTPADQVVERRLRDGRYEVVFGDGRIEWRYVDGSGFGRDYPDGRREAFVFNQVQGDSFPSLPAGYGNWGQDVEARLLSVIDGLLPEADHTPYRALHSGKPYSQRIVTHIDVIGFLSNK
jgi:uncharacterized protein YecT (DUF1311 family)